MDFSITKPYKDIIFGLIVKWQATNNSLTSSYFNDDSNLQQDEADKRRWYQAMSDKLPKKYITIEKSCTILSTALRAYTFQHIIDGMHRETIRQFYRRNLDILKAGHLLADLTIEMDMKIITCTVPMTCTQLVLDDATAILDSMHDTMLQKKREHTEDAGLLQR